VGEVTTGNQLELFGFEKSTDCASCWRPVNESDKYAIFGHVYCSSACLGNCPQYKTWKDKLQQKTQGSKGETK
jgi:hypothetical protein